MKKIILAGALIMALLLLPVKAYGQTQAGAVTIQGTGNYCIYPVDVPPEMVGDQEAAIALAAEQKTEQPFAVGRVFTDLSPGVYLITQQEGSALPFLVCVPMAVNDAVIYEITATPKTEPGATPQTGNGIGGMLLLTTWIASALGIYALTVHRRIKK